jgi:hypothetical protein
LVRPDAKAFPCGMPVMLNALRGKALPVDRIVDYADVLRGNAKLVDYFLFGDSRICCKTYVVASFECLLFESDYDPVARVKPEDGAAPARAGPGMSLAQILGMTAAGDTEDVLMIGLGETVYHVMGLLAEEPSGIGSKAEIADGRPESRNWYPVVDDSGDLGAAVPGVDVHLVVMGDQLPSEIGNISFHSPLCFVEVIHYQRDFH